MIERLPSRVDQTITPGSGDPTAEILDDQTVANMAVMASTRSLRALDWFAFFVADLHTGFGPFVSVYLTSMGWSLGDIGLALTIGGIVSLIGQMPGGAIVDAVRSERTLAACAILAIGTSALIFAVSAQFVLVLAACVLYAAANCVLAPAIAAISLGLVGYGLMSNRLARNARFASLGQGLTAIVMGAVGYLLTKQFIYLLTAALITPALYALLHIRTNEINPARAHGAIDLQGRDRPLNLISVLSIRPLLVLEVGVFLFHLANTPVLPLIGGVATARFTDWATFLVGGAVVASQFVIAGTSPWVGRKAQIWGRRPLMLISFAVLAARIGLLAVIEDPYIMIALQVLDGLSAAIFATVVPLMVADITSGTGHFNLALGIVGTALGLGASVSTLLAGVISDRFGSQTAFLALALTATGALAAMWLVLPETRIAAAQELPADPASG